MAAFCRRQGAVGHSLPVLLLASLPLLLFATSSAAVPISSSGQAPALAARWTPAACRERRLIAAACCQDSRYSRVSAGLVRGSPLLADRRAVRAAGSFHMVERGDEAAPAGTTSGVVDSIRQCTAGASTRAVAVGAALSSLIEGYSAGVIGGALLFIVPEFTLETRPAVQGLIVTSTTMGSLIGALVASRLSDSAGRKGTLLVSSSVFIMAGLLLTWSPNVAVLVLARLLVGVAIGNAGSVVPVYIAECADKTSRGALATVPQLFMSSGILLSYVVSLAVSVSGGDKWRLMTGFTLVLASLQALALTLMPESPRWLLRKGDAAGARRALERLRGVARRGGDVAGDVVSDVASRPAGQAKTAAGGSTSAGGAPLDVDVEFAELESSLASEAKEASLSGGKSGWAALAEPRFRKLLALVVSLQALQQLSGINAVVYYTPQTLKAVGVPMLFQRFGFCDNSASLLATMLAYVPKIPSLLLTMFLMDRMGRRRLLQTFVPIMALCHFGLAGAFSFMGDSLAWPRLLAMASICTYGSAFSFSLGPIPNILTAELFPMRARAAAMSTSLGAQFIFNTLVGLGFPILRHRLGTQKVFMGFGFVCVATWLFVNKFVFETKGKSLEQLSAGKPDARTE